MAVFFLLTVLLGLFLLSASCASLMMVHLRWFYDQYHPEPHLMHLLRILFLCWVVFWVFATGLALRGSDVELPLVDWIARKPRCLFSAFLSFCILYTAIAFTVPLSLYAELMVRQDAKPGKVYLLYEDINRFPRWIFSLGFLPISRAAAQRWGDGNAVSLRLSRKSLERAVREGQFVFIGSHGRAVGLLLEDGYVTPEEIKEMRPGTQLRFVYLTSCDSGAQREAWEQAFAPAQVVTYDRLTAVLEHIWWLWFTGPEIVRTMDEPPPPSERIGGPTRTIGDGNRH